MGSAKRFNDTSKKVDSSNALSAISNNHRTKRSTKRKRPTIIPIAMKTAVLFFDDLTANLFDMSFHMGKIGVDATCVPVSPFSFPLHYTILMEWLKTHKSHNKYVCFDWDLTLNIFPGFRTSDDVVTLLGGSARMNQIKDMFRSIYRVGAQIFIITANPLADNGIYNRNPGRICFLKMIRAIEPRFPNDHLIYAPNLKSRALMAHPDFMTARLQQQQHMSAKSPIYNTLATFHTDIPTLFVENEELRLFSWFDEYPATVESTQVDPDMTIHFRTTVWLNWFDQHRPSHYTLFDPIHCVDLGNIVSKPANHRFDLGDFYGDWQHFPMRRSFQGHIFRKIARGWDLGVCVCFPRRWKTVYCG